MGFSVPESWSKGFLTWINDENERQLALWQTLLGLFVTLLLMLSPSLLLSRWAMLAMKPFLHIIAFYTAFVIYKLVEKVADKMQFFMVMNGIFLYHI
jgi:hypothetical protein